jgi:hypothetical protein
MQRGGDRSNAREKNKNPNSTPARRDEGHRQDARTPTDSQRIHAFATNTRDQAAGFADRKPQSRREFGEMAAVVEEFTAN